MVNWKELAQVGLSKSAKLTKKGLSELSDAAKNKIEEKQQDKQEEKSRRQLEQKLAKEKLYSLTSQHPTIGKKWKKKRLVLDIISGGNYINNENSFVTLKEDSPGIIKFDKDKKTYYFTGYSWNEQRVGSAGQALAGGIIAGGIGALIGASMGDKSKATLILIDSITMEEVAVLIKCKESLIRQIDMIGRYKKPSV